MYSLANRQQEKPVELAHSTVGHSVCWRCWPEALHRELTYYRQGCGRLDCRATVCTRKGRKHGACQVCVRRVCRLRRAGDRAEELGERVVDGDVADTNSRSRDDFCRVEVRDAVTLDRGQLPYFSKRAKRLRDGSVQGHTIFRRLGGWDR